MIKHKQSKQVEIRRKLVQSGITKPQEFQEIISNLIGQRERLEKDLTTLRDKVVTLQQKQAQRQVTRNLRKRSSVPKNQINYRQELNKKYEQLKHWQRLSLKAMKNTRIELQYRTFLDKIACLEQQIKTTLGQLNDEYILNKRLMKALKIDTKNEKKSNNVQESIESENQLLKKKIYLTKRMTEEHINKEIYLQNYLIDIKQKDRQSKMKEREVESRLRKTSVDIRKSMGRVRTQANKSQKAESYTNIFDEIIDFQPFIDENTTKDEIYQIEVKLNRLQGKWRSSIDDIQNKFINNYSKEDLYYARQGSKLIYGKQFQIIIETMKARFEELSELNKKKVKLYLLNYQLKQQSMPRNDKLKEHKKKLTTQINFNERQKFTPLKRSRIHSVAFQNQIDLVRVPPKIYNQQQIQTQSIQYHDQEPLRREFAGQINENSFFDRNLLKQQKQSSLKALQISYSDRGIATITACYNIHTNNTIKYTNPTNISQQFLKNYCKVHVIDTNPDDFIRYFKVRHHTIQNRITQIKIVTHKNIKNGWGDSKIKGEEQQWDEDVQKEIIFDINQDQYPVSIFCSHIQKGPYWYLCGFGVEINDL